MAKKKQKRAARRRPAPEVTLRFANEGSMARKRKKSGGRTRRRSNNPKRTHHRRRRRNPGTFMERAGHLLGVAAVALGTGVLVTIGQSKVAPGNPLSLYGIPAVGFVGGAALAKSMPTVGVGVAAGSFAGFAMPIASNVLGMGGGTAASTAHGIGRAFRSMRAIDMGAVETMHGGWGARASMRGAWDAVHAG